MRVKIGAFFDTKLHLQKKNPLLKKYLRIFNFFFIYFKTVIPKNYLLTFYNSFIVYRTYYVESSKQ